MAVKFTFAVSLDTITVTLPGTDYKIALANRVVYDAANKITLFAGTPGEEIPAHYLDLTKNPERQVVICSLFYGERWDFGPEVAMVKWLTANLHREMQKRMPFTYLFLKLFDQFDYAFITGSSVSTEYFQQLSQALTVHLRLRSLTVNGQELTIPLWRRNLEYWLRRLLLDVIPLAVMILCYFMMPAYFKTNPVLFLAFLCVFPYLARFIGNGLWMLILQWFIPRGYVKNLLLARKTRLTWVDRLWMRLLWGSDPLHEKV